MSEKRYTGDWDGELGGYFVCRDMAKPEGHRIFSMAPNSNAYLVERMNEAFEEGKKEADAALKAAALDVVNRWHSPRWKWDEHTGVLIKRLADAAGIDINEP